MSAEKIEESDGKGALLNELSKDIHGKNFDELTSKRKIQVLNELLMGQHQQEAYLKITNKEGLVDLARGAGTMQQISKRKWKDRPEYLLESYRRGIYTDGNIIILDEDVSAKLLQERMRNDINSRAKTLAKKIPYENAIEKASEELYEKINTGSILGKNLENFLQQQVKEIIKDSNVELKGCGLVAPKSVILANPEQEIFTSIDAEYYARLNQEWEESTFYTNSENTNGYSPLILKSQDETKAIITPLIKIVSDSSPYDKLVREIQQEHLNAEDRS